MKSVKKTLQAFLFGAIFAMLPLVAYAKYATSGCEEVVILNGVVCRLISSQQISADQWVCTWDCCPRDNPCPGV